ncbi:MAG: adenosylcobalamin-dependent ribonucleoside-diphosphate reductase [Chlamydiae bacterium]|nr:MAG: adenosylcobalamin-dependent ribonucleoside-diphosphate reductase [Chlamydiota bacterium]
MFADIGKEIWDKKYRYKNKDDSPIDQTVEDTWRRVAYAVAMPEKDHRYWEDKFFSVLKDYKFIPAGRILANAGTTRKKVTMFNCYVMNTIKDSMEGIFNAVTEAALTQKQGGGVGFDFSTIRPSGEYIRGVESAASGPLSFMQVFDATCRTVMSAGHRRGAQMGVLSISHPDIEQFIEAKRGNNALQMFNLSVAVPDAFMEAVIEDQNWDLKFDEKIHKTVRARDLFDKIMKSTYDYAEPGFILIDHINKMNNMWYCEDIRATNPCGEQPLPPYGACLLGSINLTKFVKAPFTDKAEVDYKSLTEVIPIAVRLLDNVVEISNFPLKKQAEEAANKRRMGLGITGLADLFAMMKIKYGTEESLDLADKIMETIRDTAYDASIDLAVEKGEFPLLDRERYLEGEFIKTLPEKIRERIKNSGIRNSHLISIAPTGTISLLAGNVSSGLEPIFALSFTRRIRTGNEDEYDERKVADYSYKLFTEIYSEETEQPEYFVTTDKITPNQHINMQAHLQKYVDSSISKTINIPNEFPFDDFKDIYLYAYERGAKGCTTFRPNENISGILQRDEDKKEEIKLNDEMLSTNDELNTVPRRPIYLQGTTYKIKTPLSKQALYITINDICEGDIRRPFEIFINSKNLQHFSWIVAMTRLISAVFRRSSDPSFLVEELKSIFDPNGGYFRNGRYIPSLVAEIGDVIEQHLIHIGFIEPKKQKKTGAVQLKVPINASEPMGSTESVGMEPATVEVSKNINSQFMICPQCGERSLYFEENCNKCFSCGYSKCS